MSTDDPNRIISFAEFELDTVRRCLTQTGEPVALHSKALDLLIFLTKNNGRVVSKNEILETVWEGSFVEESNLVVQISALRKALGETKNAPRFLVTVPGKGYKFTAEINDDLMVVETHSVSELTIEEEFIPRPMALSAHSRHKLFAVFAFSALIILTVGAVGYYSFRPSTGKENLASVWTDPARRTAPRQLTANGKINVAAISPDGNFFAYTNEGSETSGLWVSGVTGTQTFEVLPPSAIKFQGLTFSPDGSYIYYAVKNEQNLQGALFRVPAFGGISEKVLSNVCCAITFSPDGRQYAFVRTDSEINQTALIVANTAGNADEKPIALRPKNTGFYENGASWSPDGAKIAVSGKSETTGENTVLLVDVKSGKVENFGEKAWNGVRRVEWLSDGSGLLVNVIEKEFWQERQIWLLEYPSGKAHKITNDLNRYGRETVSLTADNTKLLAVSAQTISNIFIADQDNLTQFNKITNNAVGKNDGQWNSLTFAPDGRLVFMRFFDKSDTLWTMNADGTNAKQLTSSGFLDRKPVVTNDGRFVYFYSNRSGAFNIWRINSDGGDLKQITTNGGGMPSVTPDGNWIFYQRDSFIWKISADGGTPVQITDKPSRGLDVSPDGKMFATLYRPAKNEKLKLAVFSTLGGEPLYLFDVAADLLYEKIRWSPDGSFIIYAFYNSTAWKQTLSGGAPEKFLEFPNQNINAFAWSPDGKQLAVAYGQELRDVVLFPANR